MVNERYKFVEDILNNVLRFTNFDNTKKLNNQMLCEQMYLGIRRDYSKELLQIIEGGGDAYARLAKITELVKENSWSKATE